MASLDVICRVLLPRFPLASLRLSFFSSLLSVYIWSQLQHLCLSLVCSPETNKAREELHCFWKAACGILHLTSTHFLMYLFPRPSIVYFVLDMAYARALFILGRLTSYKLLVQ